MRGCHRDLRVGSARPLLQTLSQTTAGEAWVLGEGVSLWRRQVTGKRGSVQVEVVP